MSLWWESSLACSINMRGGASGANSPAHHHVKTLAAAFSQLNSKTLVAHEMLAYPCVTFYPCTCELRGDVVVLIYCDDMEVAAGTTMRRRRSWSITSSTPMRDYVGSPLQLLFCCPARLVVTIHDLLLVSILRWHGISSASVAYLYHYSGIIVVLCSSWSGSCTMIICDGY
jgi:hypothetical protein